MSIKHRSGFRNKASSIQTNIKMESDRLASVVEKLPTLFEAFLLKLDDKVAIEKQRGLIEVVNQKVEDYIKKNDSKIETAQTTANILFNKYEEHRSENFKIRDDLNNKVEELNHKTHVVATSVNEATSTVLAASKKVEDAEALAERIHENQQSFFNRYFEKLLETNIAQQEYFNKFYVKLLIPVALLFLGSLMSGLLKGCTP